MEIERTVVVKHHSQFQIIRLHLDDNEAVRFQKTLFIILSE